MIKNIIFLGSSVTYGAAADGTSFVDLLEEKFGYHCIKEAVSGTTLVDQGSDSYIARMKKLQVDSKADLFVCQLSTNDATQKLPLGRIAKGWSQEQFDTSTIAGAMEYIISYAKEHYKCRVAFYTNPKYESEEYEQMVSLLSEIAEKWKIEKIDLWNDTEFNDVSEENYNLYMEDPIHPTYTGYLKWWLPKFQDYLKQWL